MYFTQGAAPSRFQVETLLQKMFRDYPEDYETIRAIEEELLGETESE